MFDSTIPVKGEKRSDEAFAGNFSNLIIQLATTVRIWILHSPLDPISDTRRLFTGPRHRHCALESTCILHFTDRLLSTMDSVASGEVVSEVKAGFDSDFDVQGHMRRPCVRE